MSSEIEKIAAEMREVIAESRERGAMKTIFSSKVEEWANHLAMLNTPPSSATPGEWVMVRKEAIDWLNGETDFECPPDRYFRGEPPRYWWRSVFREKAGLDAAPQPQERAGSDAGAVAWISPAQIERLSVGWSATVYGRTALDADSAIAAIATQPLYTRPQPASDASGVELPPLPSSVDQVRAYFRGEADFVEPGDDYYTAEQMRAYASRALAESRDKYRAAMAYADELADKLDTARAVAAQQQEGQV